MKKTRLFIFSAFLVNLSFAQTVFFDSAAYKFAQTITSEDLSKHLHILASDEYEGRETGEKGQKMAAEYMANHFTQLGLKPIGTDNSYYQKFNLVEKNYSNVKMMSENGNLTEFKDFIVFNRAFQSTNYTAEVVFVGYGLDLKGIDVKDKLVIVLEGQPSNYPKPTDNEGWDAITNTKVYNAITGGAKGLIISREFSSDFMGRMDRLKHWFGSPKLTFEDKNAPFNEYFLMNEKNVVELLKISDKKFQKLKKDIADGKKTEPIVGQKISVVLEAESKLIPTENVVGLIEGTDKKDEIIVLSAHYDHIGVEDSIVFNGADDDGSGTVAIMEMAEAFALAKKSGNGPRRSILIIGMTGEEKGLLGSEYYSDHPLFPLQNTVANLNTDMIGRLDKDHAKDPNYVYIIGSNMLSDELHNINENANLTYKNIKLDYKFNSLNDPNQFYYRSDHYNFAKNGIPVIFYFNGVHDDYHKSTDTVDKILFDKVENITQLIFYTAWELSNRENRIKLK